MNIIGIGTDIVSIKKIQQHLKKSFLDAVFTEKEIAYAKRKGNYIAHLATTFAAKEAIFKAIGTGWINGKDIEIIRKNNGEPQAVLSRKALKLAKGKVMLSLSYDKDYAVAFAVIKK